MSLSSYILGSLSLICLFFAPGAAASDKPVLSAALVVGVGAFAYLSMREDGKFGKRGVKQVEYEENRKKIQEYRGRWQ